MQNHWMQEALKEAQKAADKGEVPIGAVAVVGDQVVARAHNLRETTQDPLGHAEILLLRQLTGTQISWRLEEVTVYVTCEPCLMCMGALLHARVPRLVFGCCEPKFGACGSLYDFSKDARLNHRIEVVSGILQEECGNLLKRFFQKIRNIDNFRL
ncbi:MAG: tRNA adenosine(34) deaminase TadA [Deltaproteobacteria bacterium]|nr:tRNA adenosine(34) deaminase TadA [Deltaproteobacteria bacterium]